MKYQLFTNVLCINPIEVVKIIAYNSKTKIYTVKRKNGFNMDCNESDLEKL